MANTFITIDMVAKVSLASFLNKLALSRTANISYQGDFKPGYGATMRIDKPVQYVGRTGNTMSLEDVTQTAVPLTLATQRGVDLPLTSVERTLDLRKFTETYVDPAMRLLANQVELDGITAGLNSFYHSVGTPGTAVGSYTTINQARGMLQKYGVTPRYAALNMDDSISVMGSLQNSFNEMLNKSISQDAAIGSIASLDYYEMPFPNLHTSGAYAGTPTVNGASQTGTSLVTAGWTSPIANLLTVGDTFTITGVYGVNPITHQSTGSLQVFSVQAPASSSGGAATLTISPAITVSGPYQTVTASPANGAGITVRPAASLTYKNNFVYSSDAFCLGWANLIPPESAPESRVLKDPNSPISILMTVGFDYTNLRDVFRFDVMYGWLANPQYGCLINGGPTN